MTNPVIAGNCAPKYFERRMMSTSAVEVRNATTEGALSFIILPQKLRGYWFCYERNTRYLHIMLRAALSFRQYRADWCKRAAMMQGYPQLRNSVSMFACTVPFV